MNNVSVHQIVRRLLAIFSNHSTTSNILKLCTLGKVFLKNLNIKTKKGDEGTIDTECGLNIAFEDSNLSSFSPGVLFYHFRVMFIYIQGGVSFCMGLK